MPMSSRMLVAIALAGQIVLVAPAVAQMDPDAARAAFVAADTNQDGVIDEAELAGDAVSAFSGQDQNRNNVLEPHELDETVDAARLDEVDADGDGRLSFDEVMAHKMDQLEQADQDGDGVLSLDEVLEFNSASQGEER
jgi:Ca2+-binding EF-hand superfamily protein